MGGKGESVTTDRQTIRELARVLQPREGISAQPYRLDRRKASREILEEDPHIRLFQSTPNKVAVIEEDRIADAGTRGPGGID